MQESNVVFIDIETKPDRNLIEVFNKNIKANPRLTDPKKIKADIKKKKEDSIKAMSLDHDFSEVFCVGLKPLGGEAGVLTFPEFVGWLNEEIPIKEARGHARARWNVTRFVGFNSKNFDFPILIKSAMKAGIEDFPYSHFSSLCEKYYKGSGHIDLMEKMSYVWNGAKSLDKYIQIYLGIAKEEIDFATCTDDELREHCKNDIIQTELIFQFWNKHLNLI